MTAPQHDIDHATINARRHAIGGAGTDVHDRREITFARRQLPLMMAACTTQSPIASDIVASNAHRRHPPDAQFTLKSP